MKKLITIMAMLAVTAVLFFACKKFQNQSGSLEGPNRFSNSRDQGLALSSVICSRTLPSTISASRTLDADSAYLISGCVKVTNGATLTIPAGTVMLGEKSTKGTLIIERGAKLIANGTSSNPIVFTSDQAVNSRAPGDWGGIVMLGKANNNSTSPSAAVIEIDRACGTFTAGAVSGVTTDSDDSGSLSYVQIHYAGGMVSGDEYPSALLLAAVGSNTDFDHIQITNSIKDGMVAVGGMFNATYIANYDNFKDDLFFEGGYRGNLQYALSLRLNASAHDATGSDAIVIRNDENGTATTPYTNAVISNASIYGPAFCGSSPHGDFNNAVLLEVNARGGVFNSLIAGWPQGLLISGNSTVVNANTGLLKFSYNSFYAYATSTAQFNFIASSWNQPANVCTDNMLDWVTNPDELDCANFGYQQFSSGLNYSESVCGSYCSTNPAFNLSSLGSLQNSSYPPGSMVNNGWFNTSAKPRGAFNTSSDWTAGWTDICNQNVNFCL